MDAATKALFDQGHLVGSLATRLFPGGLAIGPRVREWNRVVEATQRALSQNRPLYEAAFRSGGAACRVDILAPNEDGSWNLYEVKSSTGVKEVHKADLALQSYVVEGSGLPIRDYFLVHIDSTYVRQGPLDLQGLFAREKLTEEVRSRSDEVAARLEEMETVLNQSNRPEIGIGLHCDSPYTCPLKEECWSFLPTVSVFNLTRGRRKGFELLSRGIVDLHDIPDTMDLDRRQRLQLETIRSGVPHVDRDGLRAFLSKLSYPLFFFDIETFAPAIPQFDHSRPYQQIPFLFSIHRVAEPGAGARHFAHMIAEPGDPRPDFLRAAQTSLEDKGSIVAYNAKFEKRVLAQSAADVLPELAEWSQQLEQRFVDLLAPFRDFSYHHPDQSGRASLKAVIGPLTGLSYHDLEIADGKQASREFLRVRSDGIDPADRSRTLRQLEEYCSLDTLGMVAIIERLQQLAT